MFIRMITIMVGESRAQVQRIMRLTEVIQELLDLIDRGNIAIMTGVDISYLENTEMDLRVHKR